MAWIESHQSLANHRKTLVLAEALDISVPTAIGHLHLLWWWCLDNAPEGNLRGILPRQIATAALWLGDPSSFLSALEEAGFLERYTRANGSSLRVHDWRKYGGKLIERRQRNARAMKEARSREQHVGNTCKPRGQHVAKSVDLENSTVENSTVEKRREENKTTSSRRLGADVDFGEACQLYEAEIGPLTGIIADRLKELVDEVPLRWFQEAVKIAAKNGKRKLSYIEGVLKNYQIEGFHTEEEETEVQNDSDFDDAAAAAIATVRADLQADRDRHR